MKQLQFLLDKTEFLDFFSNKHLYLGWVLNSSVYAWIMLQLETISIPEKLTLWVVLINAFFLLLLTLRKIARWIVRDWFPNSNFLSESIEDKQHEISKLKKELDKIKKSKSQNGSLS